MADYHKIALLYIKNNRLLLCRKRHTTSKLIFPGGCLEAGETAMECLNRELQEELGGAQVTALRRLGAYEHLAANDNPSVRKTVHIELYQGELQGEPRAASEIKELVWFGPQSDKNELSPIFSIILPDLIKRGILTWNIWEPLEAS
jgi:8-oxo-dGTP pyrophosphatase MutT (NUDIX family)